MLLKSNKEQQLTQYYWESNTEKKQGTDTRNIIFADSVLDKVNLGLFYKNISKVFGRINWGKCFGTELALINI